MKTKLGAWWRLSSTRLFCALCWWDDVVRAIASAPSVEALDRFMYHRRSDCSVSPHPLHSLWEMAASVKRESLSHPGECGDRSCIPDSRHHSPSELGTIQPLRRQGLVRRPDLDTAFASQGSSLNQDSAALEESCAAARCERSVRSIEGECAAGLVSERVEDRVAMEFPFQQNVKAARPDTGGAVTNAD